MKTELAGLECAIYAISVDNLEQATEVAGKGLTFSVGYGATKEDSDAMGAWWAEDHHGGYIQPSEFLLGRGGTVLGSMYASGPVGRMRADALAQMQHTPWNPAPSVSGSPDQPPSPGQQPG